MAPKRGKGETKTAKAEKEKAGCGVWVNSRDTPKLCCSLVGNNMIGTWYVRGLLFLIHFPQSYPLISLMFPEAVRLCTYIVIYIYIHTCYLVHVFCASDSPTLRICQDVGIFSPKTDGWNLKFHPSIFTKEMAGTCCHMW